MCILEASKNSTLSPYSIRYLTMIYDRERIPYLLNELPAYDFISHKLSVILYNYYRRHTIESSCYNIMESFFID